LPGLTGDSLGALAFLGRGVARTANRTADLRAGEAKAPESPQATKRRLGLDDERSWIVLTQSNQVIWPGPDMLSICHAT